MDRLQQRAAASGLALIEALGFARRRCLRADNPVFGIKKFRTRNCQRFLSSPELSRLGSALAASSANTKGLMVIKLLVLTGARKGEIEGLRWDAIDEHHACARLAESKTGPKILPLGAAALEILRQIPRETGSPYVFPGEDNIFTHYVGTPRIWLQIRRAADLPDVRLHDLRHTFASVAVNAGQSLPLIGKLLGHKDVKTTAQYAHLADHPVRVAADRTSQAALAALSGPVANIIQFPGPRR